MIHIGRRFWRLFFAASFLFAVGCKSGEKSSSNTVKNEEVITVKEVTRIENVLASDDMKGRKIYSPEIEKAADFIAAEFASIGLEKWGNSPGYRQDFAMVRAKQVSISGMIDGTPLNEKDITVVTCRPKVSINQQSGYEKMNIGASDNFGNAARNCLRLNKNLIVAVDKKHASSFGNLSRLKNSMFSSDKTVVFLLADATPVTFTIDSEHEITEQKLANVVAILPGKSRKEEYVIFSGHYDHIGTTKTPVNGDSIFNGANDDAAGITAVITLAKYFKKKNDNERTLVFVAFTAEESGGFGSQYFSRQFDPARVITMFNIEMIGTESMWGKNSAYITGFEKSTMGKILQDNLVGSEFAFHPDPYPKQNLFYRSDNATLARQGVPAHTISTSKMDSEPNYHKVTDEVKTLDLENMVRIIRAIALSAETIISGKDTPSRVKTEELR